MIPVKRQTCPAPSIREKLLPTDSADESDFLQSVESDGERIDFHSLRHTCATWLIYSGADVKTIQSVMRHADIKLTLDRYGHLFPGSEAEAVARLRDAFRPVGVFQVTTDEHAFQLVPANGYQPQHALCAASGTCHSSLFLHQCASAFISGLWIEGEQPNSRRLKPVLRTTGTGC